MLCCGAAQHIQSILLLNQKPLPSYGTREDSRGATQIEVAFALRNKKPAAMRRGMKASLTHRIRRMRSRSGYILCPDNGGRSGEGYSAHCLSPCSSENHSAPAHGQFSHRSTALWTASPALTLSLHSFFVSVVGLFIASFAPFVKQENWRGFIQFSSNWINPCQAPIPLAPFPEGKGEIIRN